MSDSQPKGLSNFHNIQSRIVSKFIFHKQIKQKNHCSNFIPTICDLFWVGVGVGVCLGEGGGGVRGHGGTKAAVIGGGRLFE